MDAPEQRTADETLVAARAVILAKVQSATPPARRTIRPPTLNTQQPLYPVPAALAAKLQARADAGYPLEGHSYPKSRTWSRVVVPAIALGALDLPIFFTAAILAAIHVYLAWLITVCSFIVLVACGTVATVAAISALRDPLRLTSAERSELNRTRRWRSTQPWIGPQSSTPEYRLLVHARDIVQQVASSRAWASQYLDDHRIRFNLWQELDSIDRQACQLAQLRGQLPAQDAPMSQAWQALLDRVARLQIYADGIADLDEQLARLEAATRIDQLHASLGQLAVGSALDEFAADHLRMLTTDLQHRADTDPTRGSVRGSAGAPAVPPDAGPTTSFVSSRESGT